MAHNIIKTDFEGVFFFQSDIFPDNRGEFSEIFSEKIFSEKIGNIHFIQDNFSVSKKWVLRGLHFQKQFPQAKLLRVLSGKIFDFGLDIRSDSPTFWKIFAKILDGKMGEGIFWPRGFAHGFLALEDDTRVFYKCDNFYAKGDEGGFFWNDEIFEIDWNGIFAENGLDFEKIIISEKDAILPKFSETNKNFFRECNF